ncbi:MAG: ExbD/TolR family protein [Akkermansiaceae bacterium]
MRRKHQSLAGLLDEPKFEISSLIDICFLLLIFFLVTTTIIKEEKDISMQLPDPNGERLPEAPPLVIELAESGRVEVNPDQFPELIAEAGSGSELPKLEEHISVMKRSGIEVIVQLRVAEEVDYQRFIDVMNCLAKMKVDRVGMVDWTDF